MIDYHKFEKYFRLPGGKPDANITISLVESTTKYVIMRYADSPYVTGAVYTNFPYVSTNGYASFYIPNGTFDITMSNGTTSMTLYNYAIGHLNGYEYEVIDDANYTWSKAIINELGEFETGLTLTVERYIGRDSLTESSFIVDDVVYNSYSFDKFVQISIAPGYYKFTLTKDGEIFRIYDHEEIGYFGGEPDECATTTIWGNVAW